MSNVQVQQQYQQQQVQKPKFSVAIGTDTYKRLINSTLTDPDRARRFTASIMSAVATNPALQDCDAGSILSAALLGESLNLSPSPQLGQYYLVPFNKKDSNIKVAQFQLGYKGYIQLAIRSGQYKKLNVLAIKKNELIKFDPLNEVIVVDLIDDELERESTPTTGYYVMFEYVNGFRKAMYWSKEKMEAHAIRYSQGYKAKKGFTFWEKDFDAMAYKTMLRQIISKWGIMSIEMQQAFESDTDSSIEQNFFDATPATEVQQNNETLEVVESEPEPELKQVSLSDL